MSTPTPENNLQYQDRMERLSDRVLAVGKSIAAHGKGSTFTVDAIYAAMPDINRQRLSDAIKTLKDARRIHAIGRAKGIYELEESFPAKRQISMTTLTDGWKLIEVGDAFAISVTPQEAAEMGCYLAGDAVRHSMTEKIKAIEILLEDQRHENSKLKQQMEVLRKLVAAQADAPAVQPARCPTGEKDGDRETPLPIKTQEGQPCHAE